MKKNVPKLPLKSLFVLTFLLVGFSLQMQAQCVNPPIPSVFTNSNLTCNGVQLNFATGGGSSTALIVQYDDNPGFTSPTQVVVATGATSANVTSPAGTTVYWRIRAVDCSGACTCFSAYVSGNTVAIPACPATADDCVNAIAIPFQETGAGDWTCSTTSGSTASSETNPTCWASNTLEDVWYEVTIPGTSLLVTTDQSNTTAIDAQLALYASCGSAPLSCSMDLALTAEFVATGLYPETSTGATILQKNTLTAGGTYYIRVDGDAAFDGFFCLKATGLPSNDCYFNAIDLLENTNVTGSTFGATEDCDGVGNVDSDLGGSNSVIECGSGGGASVENNIWYRFTCPNTATYVFKTSNVACNGNNGLQVWTALDNASAAQFNASFQDNGPGESCNNTAAISVNMENIISCNAGDVVRITIDGFAGEMCSFDVEYEEFTLPVVAVNDTTTTLEDTPVSFNLSDNDSSLSGVIDPTSIDLDLNQVGVQNTYFDLKGTWTVDAAGLVTYTPTADFNDTAVINYVVSDNLGSVSNVANAVVIVTPVNDAPVASDDNTTTNFNTAVTSNISVNDSDDEGLDLASIDLDPATPGQQTTFTDASGTWVSDGAGSVTFTPVNGFSGMTSVNYTISDLSGLVSNQASFTVDVSSCTALVINAGSDLTVCSGESVTLSASGALTYTWDNGVTDGVAFMPSSTQTYTVTGTDINSCTGTDQVMITVNALPTVNAGADQSICEGSGVTLSGSGALTYLWSGGVQDGVDFILSATQTYTVMGTDGNNCSNTDDVTVTVNPLPTVDAGADQTVCLGESVTLSGSGATTYNWLSGIDDGVAFVPTATQTYALEGTDANGCIDYDEVTVIVNALPTVDAGADQTICTGESVTLSGSGALSYTWSGGVQDTVSFIPTATQTYTLTGTDGNNCTNTDDVTVTLNPLPVVEAGADQTVCAGESVTLSGSGALVYLWDAAVLNGIPFSPVATQTYTVLGIDFNFCSNVDSLVITVNPLPVIDFTFSDSICNNSGIIDLNTATPSGGTYTVNGVLASQFDPAIVPLGDNVVSYEFTDLNSCTNSIDLTVYVDDCAALNENKLIDLELFPNPSTGMVHLKGSSLSLFKTISLSDQLGRVVYQHELQGSILDLSSLPNGFYTLILEGNNAQQSFRLVLVK